MSKIYFLGSPNVSQGDIFFLWLLLKKGATPRSFEEARTIDGIIYDTYKDAAVAAGHLSNPLVNEATYALDEAIQCAASPKQLRHLFVLLVKNNYPVAIAFDRFQDNLIDDRWKGDHSSKKLQLLQSLQARLHAEGCKSLSHLGINVPEGFDTSDCELRRAQTRQFLDDQKKDAIATVRAAKGIFTTEQRHIFDEVLDACNQPGGALFDIQGRAGCGKTLLLDAIDAQARLNGHLTAPTASTGLAALNQTFGTTFHRAFDVPVPDPRDDKVLQSNLPGGKRAQVMASTKLCTIDEISSLHIAAYEAGARVNSGDVAPHIRDHPRQPSEPQQPPDEYHPDDDGDIDGETEKQKTSIPLCARMVPVRVRCFLPSFRAEHVSSHPYTPHKRQQPATPFLIPSITPPILCLHYESTLTPLIACEEYMFRAMDQQDMDDMFDFQQQPDPDGKIPSSAPSLPNIAGCIVVFVSLPINF